MRRTTFIPVLITAALLAVGTLGTSAVPAANANTTACSAAIQERAWALGEAAAKRDGSMKSYRDAQRSFIPCAQRAFNMGLAYRYAVEHQVTPLHRGDRGLPAYVRDAWALGIYVRTH